MRYTDIAWDFDGTLFDSYPNCVQEFKEILKSYGCEETDEAIMEKMAITSRHAREHFAEKYGLDANELKRKFKGFKSFRPEVVKPAGFDGCFFNTNDIEVPSNADYALDKDNLAGLLDII